jgi:hypothetical protein
MASSLNVRSIMMLDGAHVLANSVAGPLSSIEEAVAEIESRNGDMANLQAVVAGLVTIRHSVGRVSGFEAAALDVFEATVGDSEAGQVRFRRVLNTSVRRLRDRCASARVCTEPGFGSV